MFEEKYILRLNDYDGPLDLLLSLVKDKKVDIMEINLAELATQYLEIINHLQEHEIDIAGDYLVMAATLIQIKARMLLQDPDAPDEEIEEDKKAILQRLAEYQQFKEVTAALREQELMRHDIFIKRPSETDQFILEKDITLLDGTSHPIKLISVLRRMFERVFAQNLRMTRIDSFSLTAKDQEVYIKELFKNNEVVTFEMIFTVPSLNHFVITLVALLDLSRKQEIIITQHEQYGEISIERGPLYEK